MVKDIKIDLLPHQIEFVESETRVTAMACAVSVGKSFIVAFDVLAAILKGEKIIIFTQYRFQIKEVILPEIEELAEKWGVKLCINRTDFIIKHGKGKALIFSNKNYLKMKGLTKIKRAYIDEAQDVLPEVLPIIKARMRGVNNPLIRITGTGSHTQSWWAKTAMHPKTNLIKADIYSNIRFNTREYVESLIEDYAELPEEFVRRELYGEFVDGGESGLFGMINEIEAWNGDTRITAGLDIAGTGSDLTCIFVMQGNRILHIETRDTPYHPETYAFVDEMYGKFKWDVLRYDATGIGNQYSFAGKPYKSIRVVFGNPAGFKFKDQRAKIYYQCRDVCWNGVAPSEKMKMPNNIQQKQWERTKFELRSTNLADTGTAKIQIEEKDRIKRKIKSSPDRADAFALACIPQAAEAAEEVQLPGTRSRYYE
jgi:hypothetical protein